METATPDLQELAQKVKEAVRLDRVDTLDGIPREAFVHAAWEGIAHYHRERTTWGDILAVKQFELEKDARLALLIDDEREQAIRLANDWLDEHFSQ